MAKYTTQERPDGFVEIFKDGTRISTTQKGSLSSVLKTLQEGDQPAAAPTGSNAAGQPGTWETNPLTGIVEFKPAGVIATSGIRRHVSPYQQAAEDFFAGADRTAPTATEKEQIREQELKRIQGQLDAIDQSLAASLTQARAAGETRLGQSRAISARRGLLGDVMGERARGEVVERNLAVEASIQAEAATKKAVILGNADKRAQELAEAETTKALTNAANYLTFLKGKQDEARADIKALAGAGIGLDKLAAEEYSTLVNQSGYEKFIFDAIYNAALPQAKKKEYNYINAGNGIIVRVDPTGKDEPKSYNYAAPEGYEFKMAGDIPLWVNKVTQDVKIAAPEGLDQSAFSKETELDTYTRADGKRVSVMYNPITKQTRTLVLGDARTEDGAYPSGFKPQTFEVSAVNQYIANEGLRQGQSQEQVNAAIKAAQADPGFFYSTLGVILADKNLSNLYYKPTTLGIPAPFVVTPGQ